MDTDVVRFNMELPKSVSEALNAEADEIGISRASLIKIILHRHIKETNPS